MNILNISMIQLMEYKLVKQLVNKNVNLELKLHILCCNSQFNANEAVCQVIFITKNIFQPNAIVLYGLGLIS